MQIEDLWYKDAIVYCLDVGTFADGNDDGYGDFRGLTRRLDHLASLGVTCVWLLPFQPTPDRDNGYAHPAPPHDRSVRAQEDDAGLRPGPAPPAGAHARRRPAAPGAGLQPPAHAAGHAGLNVARQLGDPSSLFRWMQHAVSVRRRCREFGRGRWEILESDPAVLALRYDWRGHTAIAVHNFTPTARTARLRLPDAGSRHLTSPLGGAGSHTDARGVHQVRLEGYVYRWLRAGDGVEATGPAER